MSKFELKSTKSREYRSKTFRLPADLLNDLEQRAQEKELSLNQAVIHRPPVRHCPIAGAGADLGADAGSER